jgi:dCMP deaminase
MLSNKFIKKYLRMAKFIAEDQNPCYSRHVGAVIVDVEINKVVGTGYNGPPKGVPHCDSTEHLTNVVWPQLTQQEKDLLIEWKPITNEELLEKYAGCKVCPRKLIRAEAGQRLELCSCAHAEANALINAAQKVVGCTMFCWCPLPCIECSKLIINAGIKEIYCYKEEKDYSVGSRFIIKKAGVIINELDKNFIDMD